MKRNTFYIILGLVILLEVGIFWWAVEIKNALLAPAAFILGVAAIYLARGMVEEIIDDERTRLITQQASLRTFQVFWVVFFAVNLGMAVIALGPPGFPRPSQQPPPPADGLRPFHLVGLYAIIQLVLLGLMILLYVGFRIYYARKYGDWDSDEE
ncbi:MAG: DUF2178 domain-containing protein [Methanomicrobiales archaeon]|nr:DUF2178 domain-containing protein [Methanomicrobiales archaeon]